MKQKLLINFVYYNPVGHVVEAIKLAKGFYNANKNLEIYLLLNQQSPTELARACNWIKKVYTVDTRLALRKDKIDKIFQRIPMGWDYIATDNRTFLDLKRGYNEKDLVAFHKYAEQFFKAKKWRGIIWDWHISPKNLHAFSKDLKYRPDSKITLKLPKTAIRFARKYNHKGIKICLLLGGSAEFTEYPSIDSWIKIIKSLNDTFNNLKIYLTGVKKSNRGQTCTWAYTGKDLNKLFSSFDNIIDCYDIGLWHQLALMKNCDVLIAPHTGFAFLALCVGTPWLALSGREWPEFFFNKIPFYCVLPDCKKYPCYEHVKKTCIERRNNKQRILCMDAKYLDKKGCEIIKGVKLLTSRNFTYEKALRLHLNNIKKSAINKKALFSLDDVLDLKRGMG